MRIVILGYSLLFCLAFETNLELFGQKYSNFNVAVYTHFEEVRMMAEKEWLQKTWSTISSQVHVDKIYLETFRDSLISEKALKSAIPFFQKNKIQIVGGITLTKNEQNLYETFCYTKKEDLQKISEVVAFTAKYFDEIILDDFFFTNCKCEECFKAKGDRTWEDYRLELMTNAAKNVILKTAKSVNPKCKVIIKYPNWYDHYSEAGFNLETGPFIFDGIYTGNESRDGVLNAQHLQPYLSYYVYRLLDQFGSGINKGGWVDTGGATYYDRYAEQIWLTLLSGAKEITLFNYKELLYPTRKDLIPAWESLNTSFNYSSFKQHDVRFSVDGEEVAIYRSNELQIPVGGMKLIVAEGIKGKNWKAKNGIFNLKAQVNPKSDIDELDSKNNYEEANISIPNGKAISKKWLNQTYSINLINAK